MTALPYRMDGELVAPEDMKAWHNSRGIPWGTPYEGPDPVTMSWMAIPANIPVHVANEHGINPDHPDHRYCGNEIGHALAHLYGLFRAGQEHYHRRPGPGSAEPPWPRTPAEVTDEFLRGRVSAYRRSGFERSLLEYLGMGPDEYAAWFLTGEVPARVARVWSSKAGS